MKLAVPRRLLLSVLAAVSLCSVAALPNGEGPERVPHKRTVVDPVETEGRVIVKLKADSVLMHALSATSGTNARPAHAQALAARLGMSLSDGRALGPRTQVIKGAGVSSRELAERLAAQPDVEFAEVDGRKHALAVPNDSQYQAGQTAANVPPVGQWYLRAPTSATIASSTSIVSAINAEAAWTVTNGSSSVVVADLDTGVRFDHPDLTSKLLPGYDFINNTTVSSDGDGRDADPSDPGDFGCGETTSSWHGTETAGLIGAATNNGVGMASVGRNVMVMPLRVLGCGGGYDSDIQAAMLWAVGIPVAGLPTNTTPAKVLNMSLGASGACLASYTQAIAQVNAAGAVVVVSAGNDGLDVGSPANCAGAIAVAGVRHAGTKVGYSDLGPAITIAAPAGNCVNSTGPCLYPLLTTSNSGTTTPVAGAAGATYTGTGNDASLGTSFSAPLVAGTAALMYSANPALNPVKILAALKASARTFPSSGAAPVQLVAGGPLVPVAACTAPSATAQSSECYCTTSTCGAGMLDAGAATTMASLVHADISASATSVAPGTPVTLDGAGSWPSGAASANSTLIYQWSIVSGTATVNASAAPSAATVQSSVAGTVVVKLTVTDGANNTTGSTATLNFVTPPPAASGGGGGGAMSLGWLLGWLASVIGVWVVTPRAQRRRA